MNKQGRETKNLDEYFSLLDKGLEKKADKFSKDKSKQIGEELKLVYERYIEADQQGKTKLKEKYGRYLAYDFLMLSLIGRTEIDGFENAIYELTGWIKRRKDRGDPSPT